jgi:hypothetical protein
LTAYSLSSQYAENGEAFIQDKNGQIDLAQIPDEVFAKIGKRAAPFRLTSSMLNHVSLRHGKELKLDSQDEVIDFVLNVMKNFDHVREGDGEAIIFSIEDGRDRTGERAVTVLLDSKSGGYYGLKSSGYERLDGLKKRTELWSKGANETPTTDVATANVPTDKGLQGNSPSGSASLQSSDETSADNGDSAITTVNQAKAAPSTDISERLSVSSEKYLANAPKERPDLVPTSDNLSGRKDTNISTKNQANSENNPTVEAIRKA